MKPSAYKLIQLTLAKWGGVQRTNLRLTFNSKEMIHSVKIQRNDTLSQSQWRIGCVCGYGLELLDNFVDVTVHT